MTACLLQSQNMFDYVTHTRFYKATIIMSITYHFDVFWLILDQRKTSLVVFFMKMENEFNCLFGLNIISNGLYQAMRNNISQKEN